MYVISVYCSGFIIPTMIIYCDSYSLDDDGITFNVDSQSINIKIDYSHIDEYKIDEGEEIYAVEGFKHCLNFLDSKCVIIE